LFVFYNLILSLDADHLHELITWLEDQHIRYYKIEDRSGLRSNEPETWNKAFEKYLADLQCPYSYKENVKETVEWLIDMAIESIYERTPKAQELSSAKLKELKEEKDNAQKADDPISALDFHSEEFRDGIEELRKLLGITTHPDPDVVLKAACKFIMNNLNEKTITAANNRAASDDPLSNTYLMFDFQPPTVLLNKLDLGMKSSKNAAVDAAVRALRLIHLQNLRELQTEINEVVVAVQEITADPKTDKRLGKVGF
uniref:RNA transcription, translation and transport factor protein n=1 Tax=Syphacia muris TaxID=451379 RepID=A0A0N5AME0_9BILA